MYPTDDAIPLNVDGHCFACSAHRERREEKGRIDTVLLDKPFVVTGDNAIDTWYVVLIILNLVSIYLYIILN